MSNIYFLGEVSTKSPKKQIQEQLTLRHQMIVVFPGKEILLLFLYITTDTERINYLLILINPFYF